MTFVAWLRWDERRAVHAAALATLRRPATYSSVPRRITSATEK
jgi:hypothetical protein